MRSHATNVPKGDAFYVLCQVRMCDGAARSGSGSGSGSEGAPVGDDAGNVDDRNSKLNRVRVVMHFTPVFVQSTWFASIIRETALKEHQFLAECLEGLLDDVTNAASGSSNGNASSGEDGEHDGITFERARTREAMRPSQLSAYSQKKLSRVDSTAFDQAYGVGGLSLTPVGRIVNGRRSKGTTSSSVFTGSSKGSLLSGSGASSLDAD